MPYGHVYILRNEIVCASLTTLLQVYAAQTTSFVLMDAQVTQRGSTTSAQEKIAIVRKSVPAAVTTATLGGSAGNLFKARLNDPNPALLLGVTATGWMTTTSEGTDSDYDVQDGFNVLNGWNWLPYPEKRLLVPAGGIIALKFPTTPSASQTWEITATLMELG